MQVMTKPVALAALNKPDGGRTFDILDYTWKQLWLGSQRKEPRHLYKTIRCQKKKRSCPEPRWLTCETPKQTHHGNSQRPNTSRNESIRRMTAPTLFSFAVALCHSELSVHDAGRRGREFTPETACPSPLILPALFWGLLSGTVRGGGWGWRWGLERG